MRYSEVAINEPQYSKELLYRHVYSPNKATKYVHLTQAILKPAYFNSSCMNTHTHKETQAKYQNLFICQLP